MVRYFLVFNVFLNLKLRYSTQFSFEQRLVFNLRHVYCVIQLLYDCF